MSADFDAHARSYAEDVSGSVAFSGKDVEFFTRRKAHHLVDLARRHLGDPLALRVLDVGCGIGMTDALLASSFGQLHGIDVAADAVAVLFFVDGNANGLLDGDETNVVGAVAVLTGAAGEAIDATSGDAGVLFEGLAAGDYTLTAGDASVALTVAKSGEEGQVVYIPVAE